MLSSNELMATLNQNERKFISKLNSPFQIQSFLDSVPYSCDPIYRCPIQVLRDRTAHCFDGAVFGAAMLSLIGFPPLILDMIPNGRDDEHMLALFKIDGHWGAIAKSNTVGLRFREPVYRSLRELVMSYFELYYNTEGEKTLRGYTVPLNLETFDADHWMTSAASMDRIAQRTDEIRRYPLMTPKMIERLSPVDDRLFEACLLGADDAGLFTPEKK